jgi:hypothetical protein
LQQPTGVGYALRFCLEVMERWELRGEPGLVCGTLVQGTKCKPVAIMFHLSP